MNKVKNLIVTLVIAFFLVMNATAQTNHLLYGLITSGGSGTYGTLFTFNDSSQALNILVNFAGNNSNGADPSGSLLQATNGKLYGFTSYGGSNNNDGGTIFEFNPTGNYLTTLVNLNYTSNPYGSLIQANNGKLYGMTYGDGYNGAGAIISFNYDIDSMVTEFSFDGIRGEYPYGSLLQASNGMLYGLTSAGGNGSGNGGTLFSYNTLNDSVTALINFGDSTHNGLTPYGSLIQASNGLLYGTTSAGGDYGFGTIFTFNPANNAFNTIVNFDSLNGSNPRSDLLQASNGNFYGVTANGGPYPFNYGTLFELNQNNTLTQLAFFDYSNGSYAEGTLMQAADGNLYGMTNFGGANTYDGEIFQYNLITDSLNVEYSFGGADGANPRYTKFIQIHNTPCAPPSEPGTISGPTHVCDGTQTTYSIQPVPGATSYTWTIPSTWTGSSDSTSISVLTVQAGGTITVVAHDSCGSSLPRTLTVTLSGSIPGQPGPINGDTTVCAGLHTIYSVPAVFNATNYVWTLPSGWSGTSSTDSISVTVGTGSGYVKVAAHDSCGNSALDSVYVNVAPPPSVSITTPNDTIACNVDTMHLFATQGFASYLWSNQSTTNPLDIIVVQTTTYTVTVTNSAGCTNIAHQTITINHPPSQPGPIIGNDTVCALSSQIYYVAPVPGATSYIWTIPTTSGWSGSSSTDSITIHIGSQSGTIKVVAHDTCGNSSIDSFHIVVRPAPTVTIQGPSTACDSATLSASTSSHYLWSTQATTQSILVFTSGTYTLTVTTSEGCTNSATHSITINQPPNQPSPINGDTILCAGNTTSYYIAPDTGATSYTWTLPQGWILDSTLASGREIIVTADTIGGEITVIAHDTCGNSVARILNVSVGGLTVSITSNGPDTFCQGGYVILSAGITNTNTYLWSTGATASSILVHSTDTYIVTVTQSSTGCTGIASQIVVVNQGLTDSITVYGTPTYCQGTSVYLNAQSGYTSYLWSNGGTSQFTSVTASGDYVVSVINSFGCHDTADIFITFNPVPHDSVSSSGPTTFCQGGSVELNAGQGYSSYLWSNSSIADITSVNTSGTYTVTVTNSFGCTGTASQTVTVNPSPIITTTHTNVSCYGGDNGTITVTGSGGDGVYIYSIDSGNTYTNPMTSSYLITNLTSGSYFVLVTDDISGCTSSVTLVNITQPYPISLTDYNATNPTCYSFSNGSITTNPSGGTTPYSYLWNNSSTNGSQTGLTAGTYTLTLTDANACTTSATFTLSQPSMIADSISSNGPTTFCHGDSVTLNAGSFTSYLWSTNATTSHITVNTSAIYSVTVTNYSGCTGSGSIVVNASLAINPVITPSGPTAFCQGGSVTLNAGQWTSYHWSNGATTQSITDTVTGTFRVTVTNSNGCTGTATQSVNVFFLPIVSIIANGSTSICQGNSVTLDAGLFADYIWSNGSTNETISASTAGTYTVTVTNNNGCMASASKTITVNQNPSTAIIPNGPTTFCQGGSVMLDAGINFTYHWSNNATTEDITVNTTGTYTVTVSFVTGCTGTASVAVNVSAAPSPTITPNGPTTFCNGGSVMLDAGSWVGYHWSTGASTETIFASTGGNYIVTVTDSNGCNGMTSIVVMVNANPTLTITGNSSICSGNSTTLSTGTFNAYNWSTGASTQSISVSTSGTYSVTVTNSNGCIGMTSETITVNNNPTPAITHNGPTTFCAGGSVALMAGSYSLYLWNTGATTGTLSVNTTGTFTVTVTDGNGCTGTASIVVTVNATPIVNITANNSTTFCENDSVTLNAGVWSSYSWNTGNTTQDITVYGSQPYCVTVTNVNGCSGSACQFVDVFALPNPTITSSGPTIFCSGSSATLSVGTYATYLWSTGATSAIINAATSGIYSVTVANINNCTAAASIGITVNPSPTPTITPSGPTTLCQGGTVTLNAGLYVSYHWMNSQTTETILVYTSGNFVVTVTGNNGCTGSATQIVTVTPFNNPVITASGPVVFCSGGSVTLDAGSYATYSWSNGATTEDITTGTSGLYTVTVSNRANCSGTAIKSVSSNPAPAPVILITNLNNLCGGGYVRLNVGASFPSYLWNTGATTQLDSVNIGGTYTVTVTSAQSCTGSASTTVTSGCTIPVIAATPTTNIGATYAMGNWIQPSCHISYNVQISVHNMNVWTTHTIAPNTHYTFSGLTANTMYDWQVQTNCNSQLTSVSGYSASQTFTTLLREENVATASSIASFNVYPNPASDEATIVFSSDKEENYTIRLMDVIGREVFNINNTSVVGDNQYQMNLSSIAKGIYMVVLQKGDGSLTKKIVVN